MPDLPAAFTDAIRDRHVVDREIGAVAWRPCTSPTTEVLKPELAASLGAERFLKEIEIAARQTHPHIVPLHDSGAAAGFLYYVMPLIDGESLRARLRRETRLETAAALGIVQHVGDALSYAHRQGLRARPAGTRSRRAREPSVRLSHSDRWDLREEMRPQRS